jgi:hypothetical protein
MIEQVFFESLFFSNGQDFPDDQNLRLFCQGAFIFCTPEFLFLYLPSAFREYCKGEKVIKIARNLSPKEFHGIVTILVRISKQYKSQSSFMINQNEAEAFKLVGQEFQNSRLEAAGDESLANETSTFTLPPLHLLNYVAKDFEYLDNFALHINDTILIRKNKYFLYLISGTIKKIVLESPTLSEYSI